MLLYFYLGSLSWQTFTETGFEIIKSKQHIINESNVPAVLINYMKYVRSLEFEEKPNYCLLSDNFKREIESI
jgi:hypothetical protein